MLDIFYFWLAVYVPIILLFYIYYESKGYIIFHERTSNRLWLTAAIISIVVVAAMVGLKHILHPSIVSL